MSDAKRNKILVFGGAAHANRGDTAMQAGLVNWLRKRVPDGELVFLSNAPEQVADEMGAPCIQSPDAELSTTWTRETPKSTDQRKAAIKKGRRFVWRARLFKWFGKCPGDDTFFRELAQTKCVLVPGSGAMNSLWWHDWMYPKAFTVLAAKTLGVPVVMTSQGVGPEFSHELDAQVACEMFSACSFVGVRDRDQSGDLLKSIGVPAEIIHHSGDDALLFESDNTDFPQLPEGKTLVGVNLRDSSTYQKGFAKSKPEDYAAWLDAIAAKHEVHFVFIPVSYNEQDSDPAIAKKVVAEMQSPENATVVDQELDAAGIRRLCASMDYGIGISYHFLLFSLSAGVPSLLLFQNAYYKQKLEGLGRLYSVEDRVVDLEAGRGDFDRLVEDREALKKHLEERQEELEKECHAAREQIAERFLLG